MTTETKYLVCSWCNHTHVKSDDPYEENVRGHTMIEFCESCSLCEEDFNASYYPY